MENIDDIMKRNSIQYMVDDIIIGTSSTKNIGEFTPIDKNEKIYRQVKEDKKCNE